MDQIIVQMADCQVADVPGQVLATYALGSCIGLAVHDAKANVGGLLHFMLPDSTIDPARGRENPFMFADTGIPLLLERVCQKGALKQRLVVHAAGGAQMMDRENVFEIGKRNYLAMRKILWKKGIMVHAESVGGGNSRTVRLQVGTGRVWLQEGGLQKELVPGPPEKGGNNGLSPLNRR
jgi:chemotaxis protein CheD